MPKKLSSVENFCLFEHMIACLKAFENVVINKTSQQMVCFWHLRCDWIAMTQALKPLTNIIFGSELHHFKQSVENAHEVGKL